MVRRSKNYLIVLGLASQLFFFGPIAAQSLQAGDTQSTHEMLLSVSAPDQSDLTLVSLSPVFHEGAIVGAIALYDDARTKRPGDYLELYNRAGDLLAIGWFDRFGIERTAVDRGLLEAADKLQGVFIVLIDGDSI
ncbi:MAG: hypothetical protein HYY46_00045 [Deltaproteobacteria bacterium]|nr:hypothetical protein [Deltaproteobacteria bacterium]